MRGHAATSTAGRCSYAHLVGNGRLAGPSAIQLYTRLWVLPLSRSSGVLVQGLWTLLTVSHNDL